MVTKLKNEICIMSEKSIFSPVLNCLSDKEWLQIIKVFKYDFNRYYNEEFEVSKIKYFPGLLATLFYRISRYLFNIGNEKNALDFSNLGTSLTSIELYYSSIIGKGLKINHGVGTVIGSRTTLGNNVLLHHGVTIGEKNGGRAKIGDNVIIYPGAVIVGPIFIGHNSIVGANVFVDKSHPENSKIF